MHLAGMNVFKAKYLKTVKFLRIR